MVQDSSTARCGLCGRKEPIPVSPGSGKALSPEGWVTIQITSTPMFGMFLCPNDGEELRKFLGVSEAVRS